MSNATEAQLREHNEATHEHISRVQAFVHSFVATLILRAHEHDESKLYEPEASIFAEVTPKLAGTTYGSDEYQALLDELSEALDHHYASNSHHPEHHEDGVAGMTLGDVVEMFCDWLAATERHDDGDIMASIDHNEERFDMAPQLAQIFRNTVEAREVA